ncbi:MAG: sigma-54-dependent Fis family transcriptional regulator [bacterium]|nr:sigma-54-dependent Fis family transcriptional regulator [bacterium]
MSDRKSVLVVEDEADQRVIIGEILDRSGFAVQTAGTVNDALALIQEQVPDVVLCDWRLPDKTGGDLLASVRENSWPCAFIVMTAYGSITHAVEAIRAGADDYLSKPFERDALILALKRVLRTRELELENRRLQEAVEASEGSGEMIGRAPAMQRLYRTIKKVGASEATVLVRGESGTGKELVARTLHRVSRRSDGPFIAVNCAAIPESLMESELFGHERGTFTGAHRRRHGRFEEADGGTLFLDEIASMPLALQATLLRVLQERRLTRLGGSGEIEIDVRVVAASNQDLRKLSESGSFREDLFYRLNVVPIELPSLRERGEDIPLLAQTFLERANQRHGMNVESIRPALMKCLIDHSWPGNVRELENTIERLVLLSEDNQVSLADLPSEIRQQSEVGECPLQLPVGGLNWDQMEDGLLRQALDLARGNRARASRLLGLSYKAFLYRLQKHGLDVESCPSEEERA